jgi:hypothetical protein
MEAYSPMMINSLFLAAVVQREVLRRRERGEWDGFDVDDMEGGYERYERDKRGLEDVLEMLEKFGTRWRLAGTYFRAFDLGRWVRALC